MVVPALLDDWSHQVAADVLSVWADRSQVPQEVSGRTTDVQNSRGVSGVMHPFHYSLSQPSGFFVALSRLNEVLALIVAVCPSPVGIAHVALVVSELVRHGYHHPPPRGRRLG